MKSVLLREYLQSSKNNHDIDYIKEHISQYWDFGDEILFLDPFINSDYSIAYIDDNEKLRGFSIISKNEYDDRFYFVFLYLDEDLRNTKNYVKIIYDSIKNIEEDIYILKTEYANKYKNFIKDSDLVEYYIADKQKVKESYFSLFQQ